MSARKTVSPVRSTRASPAVALRQRQALRPAELALALAGAFAVAPIEAQTVASLPYSGVVKTAASSAQLPSGGVAVQGQASFDFSQQSKLLVTTQNGAGTRGTNRGHRFSC